MSLSVTRPQLSALKRLPLDLNLKGNDRDELQGLTAGIVEWLCKPESNFNLQHFDAEGLVQHLGLPTVYIDFSSDPDVAAAFAVGDRPHEGTRTARICVLSVEQALCRGQLANYREHRWCERARRQQAFGYAPIGFDNLKGQQALELGGFRWFEFEVGESDRAGKYGKKYRELLHLGSDPVAGLLRSLINSYVADTGKLRPSAASWIATKIAMAPLVGQIRNGFFGTTLPQVPEDVEFIAPDDVLAWDEESEREWSLRYGSDNFPEHQLRMDYFARESETQVGFFVYPRTFHYSPRV